MLMKTTRSEAARAAVRADESNPAHARLQGQAPCGRWWRIDNFGRREMGPPPSPPMLCQSALATRSMALLFSIFITCILEAYLAFHPFQHLLHPAQPAIYSRATGTSTLRAGRVPS